MCAWVWIGGFLGWSERDRSWVCAVMCAWVWIGGFLGWSGRDRNWVCAVMCAWVWIGGDRSGFELMLWWFFIYFLFIFLFMGLCSWIWACVLWCVHRFGLAEIWVWTNALMVFFFFFINFWVCVLGFELVYCDVCVGLDRRRSGFELMLWWFFFFFLNFWVCVLGFEFVFLVFLFKTHLDLSSYDF